jgi:RimJ/RimL family protein N-acetyltransferase
MDNKRYNTPQNLHITKAVPADIDDIMRVYAAAREFMIKMGTPKRWEGGWPFREVVEKDHGPNGNGYVVKQNDRIVGVFVLDQNADEVCYHTISGKWLNDKPYAVIHRLASDGTVHGIAATVLDFCFSKCENIRDDTHPNNTIMQKILLKYGFSYCGEITHTYTESDGSVQSDIYFAYQLDKSLK